MHLFKLLKPNTTILTPNSRLSVAVQKQFQTAQLEQQKTWWQSLDVLPITSWIERTWKEISAKDIATTPLLLKSNQENILWEEIIRKSSAYDFLLQKTATAELAKSAWETLQAWQVDIHDAALNITDDSNAFQAWATEYTQLTAEHNWINKSSLPDYIMPKLLAKQLTPPAQIILIGFTEISPQYKNLLNTYEKLGTEIIHYQSPRTAKSIQKISLTDEENEIRTMARWAKAIYDQKPENKPYYIGCVILNLDKLRSKVLQIFCETFSLPNTFTFDNRTLPFNITAGQYLLDFPVIRTAFDLLELHQDDIALDKFSNILRSPFVGDAEHEQIKRAYFETKLRNANAATIDLTQLIEKNSQYNFPNSCPKLAKRFIQFNDRLTQLNKAMPVSEWVNHFLHLLNLLGWPGERSINSFEFQVVDSWLELLNEFRTFDDILGPQKFSKALYYLNQITAKKVFQPKTPEVPIQILGILEAVELPFEHLWIMGLDDTRWPASPKPNPLIPQSLQKKLQMPHSTAEREFIYCKQLMQQIEHSANQIIYSHALKNDGTELQPSSLLSQIKEVKLEDLHLHNYLTPAETIYAKKELETLADNHAPALHENEEVRGGTHIFKQQAACPFKAFAELRLHARRLETPTLGLRPIDRGNIVHKALELVWQTIKTSDALIKLTEQDLQTVIQQAAHDAIHTNIAEQIKNPRYIALEQQRLEKLLFDWLQIEKERPAFEVIAQEHERIISIGKIDLTVRVDRIDALNDGTHMIIDYKTGKNNEIQNWFGSRPDEPQLPLYCITDNGEAIAISFAQLHPADLKFIGVAKRDVGVKTIKLLAETNSAQSAIWPHQIEEWRNVLEKLADDFSQGVATVDPKKQEETCSLCNLQPLCRIHEQK